jgi:uncharacterized protein (TIGR00725 family)
VHGAVIAIVGTGDDGDLVSREAAEECGRLAARAGAVVMTGGLGGVMEAATRGARAEGGVAVAVLPGTDRRAARGEPTVAVCTGAGQGRNLAVVASADAVIAIGGGWDGLLDAGDPAEAVALALAAAAAATGGAG